MRAKSTTFHAARGRAALACALTLALAALAPSPAPAAVEDFATLHPAGLRLPTPAERAQLVRTVAHVTRPSSPAPSLPAAVKNHRYLPAVRNQLLSNCGAFAPSYYYKTWQEAKERGWEHPDPAVTPERVMSPGFTYPMTNGGEDAGASIDSIMAVMKTWGISTWADYPEQGDFVSFPPEEVWRKAIPFRSSRWWIINHDTAEGILALKEHLAGGDLAVVAVPIYSDVHDVYPNGTVGQDNDVIYDNGSGFRAWHALTVIGYDDARAYDDGTGVKHGAFLVVNSWGPGWGVVDPDVGTGGFAWLAYDYLQSKTWYDGLGAREAYVMEDRTAYEPSFLGIYGLEHERRNDLYLEITGGPLATPRWNTGTIFPPSGGGRPFSGRIVVDLTDFTDGAVTETLWLTVWDYGRKPELTGSLTYFAVERAGQRRVSGDLPLPTVDWTSVNPTLSTRAVIDPFLAATDTHFDLHLGGGTSAAWTDIDGDGDPDLALCGWDTARQWAFTRIYRNDGAGGFADLRAGLPGVAYGAVAWGDADGNGAPDLAFCGYDAFHKLYLTRIFLNRGAGIFADSRVSLPGFESCMLAWGDYDADGRLDLLASGATDASARRTTRLFRNNGTPAFTDTRIHLPAASDGGVAWGDFSGDGLLDLALTRADGPGTEIYENTGAGGFRPWVVLPALSQGALAAADLEGDGDLDLAFLGSPVGVGVYRNDGAGVFTAVSAGTLPALGNGSLAWGDLENDGDPDLAVLGKRFTFPESRLAAVLLNDGAGAFSDVGAPLPAAAGDLLHHGAGLAWADVEGDGDLDLALFGDGKPATPWPRYGALFVGSSAGVHANAPPAAPTNLRAEVRTGGTVAVSWDASTDTETPAPGLSYAVRLGTASGGRDIAPGLLATPFFGAYASPLAAGGVGRLFTYLRPGTYFWRVRALDAGLAASPWSAEASFTVSPAAGVADAR